MSEKVLIGKRVLSDAVEKFESILMDNADEINEAYKLPDANHKLILAFQVRFIEPKTGGGVNVRVSTSSALKKLKASSSAIVDERQGKLPLKTVEGGKQ